MSVVCRFKHQKICYRIISMTKEAIKRKKYASPESRPGIPHELYILGRKARDFAPNIGIDTQVINMLGEKQKGIDMRIFILLGLSMFDAGMRRDLGQPKISLPKDTDARNYVQASHDPVDVFSSNMVEPLENAGYRYIGARDIKGVGQSNKVSQWAGNALVRNVARETIVQLKKKGVDAILVRIGGDELGFFADRKKHKQTARRSISRNAGTAKGLVYNNEGDIITQTAQTKPIDMPQSLRERVRYEGLVLDARIVRLKKVRPDKVAEIDAIASIGNFEQKEKILRIIEDASYDPILQHVAEQISDHSGENGQQLYAYSESNSAYFIRHLQSLGPNSVVLRIGSPGMIKEMNDDLSLGRDKADELIRKEYERVVKALPSELGDIHTFRDEGYTIVALPESLADKIPDLTQKLTKELTDYYKLSGGEVIPVTVAAVPVPHSLNASLDSDSSEAGLLFQDALANSKPLIWTAATEHLKNNPNLSDHHYATAVILHPAKARTPERVRRMGLPEREIIPNLAQILHPDPKKNHVHQKSTQEPHQVYSVIEQMVPTRR